MGLIHDEMSYRTPKNIRQARTRLYLNVGPQILILVPQVVYLVGVLNIRTFRRSFSGGGGGCFKIGFSKNLDVRLCLHT